MVLIARKRYEIAIYSHNGQPIGNYTCILSKLQLAMTSGDMPIYKSFKLF